jgi:two-component system sensor histidine kinase BaeS
MKPGITFKLFLAILLCCIVVALAMTAGNRYSTEQGFLGYMNEQETQRVASLRPVLARAYHEHGNSWDFLRDQPREWFVLLVPPGTGVSDVDGPRGVQSESDLIGVNLRVTLLDAQRQIVIGNRRTELATYSPIVQDGLTVGWIALVPFREVSTGAGQRFQQQQDKANLVIGAVVIVLAAAVAWLLARMVLAPLKRIAHSTHQLAAGDYTSRVVLQSQDELGVLAQDFNQLAVTLERNEQLRRDFMADVSHELRTPLAVLRGEIEAIEDGVRPLSMALIPSLHSEVRTLGKLVDDLYQLSLSDAGALAYRKRPVDVLAVLRGALEPFAARYQQKGIQIENQIAPGLQASGSADPDRLRQLFTNLLSNTWRYTDSGGRLRLRAAITAGQLQLTFDDSAPGLPDSVLPHIFERFFRAEGSRNRATGGAGLGLSICRNIVEAHQGEIRAQASPLGGVTISVTLPLAATGAA